MTRAQAAAHRAARSERDRVAYEARKVRRAWEAANREQARVEAVADAEARRVAARLRREEEERAWEERRKADHDAWMKRRAEAAANPPAPRVSAPAEPAPARRGPSLALAMLLALATTSES